MSLKGKDRERILNYVNGALVYYGIIETGKMLELTCDNLNLQVNKKDFDEIMNEAAMNDDDDLVIDRYKGYLFNDFMIDKEYIIKEQKARKEITYRPISEKMALSALPLGGYSSSKKNTDKLVRFLVNKGWSQEGAAERVFDLELDLNNGSSHMELIQSIMEDVEFKNEEELSSLMILLNDFFSNIPQWILKGWPSREIFERFEKPKLKPLPEEPFQQLNMAAQGQFKVGRNEPCPCGSGKKYKKCCLNQSTGGYTEKSPQMLEDPTVPEVSEQDKQENAGQAGSFGDEREPTIEEWTALYNAAIDFKAMKCWEWMYEDEIFGVKNPETGETAYVSITGENGQAHSLHAYLGAGGLKSFYDLIECNEQDEALQIFLGLNRMVASFENREDLHKNNLELIKSLGLKFRGKKQWPRFQSYKPGQLPWFLNAAECRFLTAIIRQAMVVADRCRDNNDLLIAKPDQMLIRTLKGSGESAEWCDTYSPVVGSSRTYSSYRLTDELEMRKMIKAAKKTNAIWEADIFYLLNPIVENKGDRPYMPTFFLIVEKEEAMIIGHELIRSMADNAMSCVDKLVEVVEHTASVPGAVVVEKEELFYCLMDVCEQLGIELKLVDKLKVLPKIRTEVSQLKIP